MGFAGSLLCWLWVLVLLGWNDGPGKVCEVYRLVAAWYVVCFDRAVLTQSEYDALGSGSTVYPALITQNAGTKAAMPRMNETAVPGCAYGGFSMSGA